MKRSFVVSLFGSLVGFGLLLVLLSVVSSVGAQSVEVQSSVSRPDEVSASTPLTSTFTYQGQLKNGGTAVNGSCQMAFRLYDDPAAATTMIGSPITTSVPVVNGLFTVGLNFGSNAFDASGRWLDVQVNCGSGFTPLTPRQALTPVPYALAFGAPGSVSGYMVPGAAPGPYPTIGFNTYGTFPYYAGATGYGGVLQFQNADGTLKYYTGSTVAAGQEHVFTPRFTINKDGYVGIGTIPDENATLTVQASQFGGFLVKQLNGSAAFNVSKDGLVFIRDLTIAASTTHVCSFGGYIGGCSSAAEYVPTIDRGLGFPETADVVSIVPDAANPYGDEHGPFVVAKSTQACDDNLLGFIVNPESGADGKKLNEYYLPLAIYGYFPAKVTMENGVIKRGDPLTSSSKPGYAMKATQACKIIGYALEDADHEGQIQVFANHGESSAPEVAALRTQVQALKEQNAALDARLTALEQAMSGQAQTQRVPAPTNQRGSK